jgi:hypothetical protein
MLAIGAKFAVIDHTPLRCDFAQGFRSQTGALEASGLRFSRCRGGNPAGISMAYDGSVAELFAILSSPAAVTLRPAQMCRGEISNCLSVYRR